MTPMAWALVLVAVAAVALTTIVASISLDSRRTADADIARIEGMLTLPSMPPIAPVRPVGDDVEVIAWPVRQTPSDLDPPVVAPWRAPLSPELAWVHAHQRAATDGPYRGHHRKPGDDSATTDVFWPIVGAQEWPDHWEDPGAGVELVHTGGREA